MQPEMKRGALPTERERVFLRLSAKLAPERFLTTTVAALREARMSQAADSVEARVELDAGLSKLMATLRVWAVEPHPDQVAYAWALAHVEALAEALGVGVLEAA